MLAVGPEVDETGVMGSAVANAGPASAVDGGVRLRGCAARALSREAVWQAVEGADEAGVMGGIGAEARPASVVGNVKGGAEVERQRGCAGVVLRGREGGESDEPVK